MRFKDIFVWLFVFITGSLIVSFLISPQSFQSFKMNIQEITSSVIKNFDFLPFSERINFEEFNKAPEEYVGKNVTAVGKYENYMFKDYGCGRGTTLVEEKKGYELPFCPINNPDLRFKVGEIYTISGTIQKVESQSIFGEKRTYFVLMEN